MTMIFIRADDFGMTRKSCQRIIRCIENGPVNGISILPNGCLSYGAELLKGRDLNLSVHLNFVEGKSLCPPEEIPLLAKENGYMKHSFFGLFMLNCSTKRKELETQIYRETRKQLQRVCSYFPEGAITGIDSHQHTHMIPAVFHGVMRALHETNASITYIRIPAEPILPFLKKPSLYHTYSFINLTKQMLLNLLWRVLRKYVDKEQFFHPVFCGILFSGFMDEKRIRMVLPEFSKIAKKKSCDLELLFHPGYIYKGEEVMDPFKKSFNRFYYSEGRKIEYETLIHLRGWLNG